MIAGLVAALLAGLLGWLLVHDVRARETALAIFHARRDDRPRIYWAIMAFWSLCLLMSALLAWGAYMFETSCTGDPCVVMVKIPAP